MAASLAMPSPRRLAIPGPNSLAWPIAGLALLACAHLYLATNRAINWDEFFHYSQIHQLARGEPLQPLQTLHARLFGWILDLPGGPIDQIRAARWVIFALLMSAAGSIYLLASRFAARPIALTSALLYLSAGFVLQHGTSLRADGMLAALLMGALALLGRARLTPLAIVAAGALCGLAALESIKVVLYAPAFLGLAWLRWSEAKFSRTALLRLAAIAVSAGVIFALLYLAHASGLGGTQVADRAAERVVQNSGHKMFAIGGLPYYRFILKAALLALVFAVLVLWTPETLLRSDAPRDERIALAGLWLPISVVAFYHNTAPYFYVFILAPVAVACAPAAGRLIERYSLRAVCCLAALSGLALLAIEDPRAQGNQARIISAAATIFRQPVAYFDFPAMLGAWPKANHFMTPWGQDAYLSGEAPSFREIMQARPVPLVIENSPAFEQLYETREPVPDFLPEDAAALRANYIRYWGPLFVAGRTIPGKAPAHTAEFLVPGPYRVIGGPAVIDGRVFAPGAVVRIERGTHSLAAPEQTTRLVWGEHPGVPADAPPTTPFWADF